MWTRIIIGLSFIIGVGVGSIIDSDIWAGLLEPPSSAVPEGAPTSTMRALDELNGAWSQTLSCETQADCPRFELVMNNEAVLDKNTGLVWEQSPLITEHDWSAARVQCTGRKVGGQLAWRLPSVHELASLLDPGNPVGDPDLPPGHPFESNSGAAGVVPGAYWSATTDADDPTTAWDVHFGNGTVDANDNKVFTIFVWCVRGGHNHGNTH